MKKYYRNELISVDNALELLGEADIEINRQGLTRYLRNGEILGQPPSPNYPKEGWTVDSHSLQEFIDLKKMNINELRVLVKELREENYQLKENSDIIKSKFISLLEEWG